MTKFKVVETVAAKRTDISDGKSTTDFVTCRAGEIIACDSFKVEGNQIQLIYSPPYRNIILDLPLDAVTKI